MTTRRDDPRPITPTPVDRCICHQVTFAQLRPIAARLGGDFAELCRQTGCCTGCASCEPYVRLMLETGRTAFPVLTKAEADAALMLARRSGWPDGEAPGRVPGTP